MIREVLVTVPVTPTNHSHAAPQKLRLTAKVSRLPQLDGLRGVAVLAVLVHHFLPVEKILPADFLTLGLLGVRFFFTLSGFLITGLLLGSQTLGTFYFRRAMRIFPAYYLCLVIVAVLGVLEAREFFWWHASYLSNVLFTFYPGTGTATSHFWSLAVEEQFYFVWPWLVLNTTTKNVWKLAVGAILCTLVFKTVLAFTVGAHPAGGLLPFACLDSLGLGALLACFSHDERLQPYRERFLRVALASGSMIVAAQTILYFSGRGSRIFYSTAYLGVSLVFTWLVGKAADGKLAKVIEARPLLYTGKISYGIYLWHYFMPGLVVGTLGQVPSVWVLAGLATVFTYITAAVSWTMVESPLNSFKDKITARRTKLTAATLENSPASV